MEEPKGKNLQKGWYTRGYLPHRDEIGLTQSINFRLADSLPEKAIDQLKAISELSPDCPQNEKYEEQLDAWLDRGYGCCALANPKVAEVIESTLLKFHQDRYELLAWCIMPNHVHALIQPKIPIGKILQSWKSYTGRWAMERRAELGLGVPGKTFWMREYFDRFIRNEDHLQKTIHYIHQNPVKAGLCQKAEDWRWSSAWRVES